MKIRRFAFPLAIVVSFALVMLAGIRNFGSPKSTSNVKPSRAAASSMPFANSNNRQPARSVPVVENSAVAYSHDRDFSEGLSDFSQALDEVFTVLQQGPADAQNR